MAARDPFTTVRTEGGLLPADFLQRIATGDRAIDGLTPESYHLADNERINEATNRAWNRVVGAWAAFKAAREKLDPGDLGTTATRERWLLIVFQELGYGRLVASKAIEIAGKGYPISHSWNHTPIHLVGCNVELDRRTKGAKGAAGASPHGLVQEFLNRSEECLWGIASNGLCLRLLRDNVSLTRQAYVEFDLEAMMEGEVYSDFVLLWLLCHESRVESDKPDECWLERWAKAAREQGTRALERLRLGVEAAIEALGKGFLAHPRNTGLREKLRAGELDKQDYYRQLLRLVYRLLSLFVAEDRGLLLDPSASQTAKERYWRYYSTVRLRRLAQRRRGSPHADLYQGLRVVMAKLGTDTGCAMLGLPALGSFLWSSTSLPDLETGEIPNADFLDAIRAIAFTIDGKVLRAIDYKNLAAEELGSVYESLLELHPEITAEPATFRLTTAGGHERKTTGSYYTPESLVQCLLDSALDPMLDEACKQSYPEDAILSLKICDPACGSGHFLIAAAHRIAKRLAAVHTGDEEPSPEATRKALRDVIGHCIYAVDLNPMAVELCKVSLWMEALEPGKPLSFLDHRIVSGNSLLGTTPALLAKGIPDDAFSPIEGDDRRVVSALKRQNRKEREGQTSMFAQFVAEASGAYASMSDTVSGLDALVDDSITAIHQKESRYRHLVESSAYATAKQLADAWCAAFVCKKTQGAPEAITHDIFARLQRNADSVPPSVRKEIEDVGHQYQFLHWHLAFPDVFRVPAAQAAADNEQAGWSGGFDVVLSNPPWERIKLQEKEWFAECRPDIANASNAAVRGRLIENLRTEDSTLYAQFQDAVRHAEGEGHLMRNSGLYALCGRGDINVYAIFAERMRALLSATGRAGAVLPTAIATGDTTKFFFQDLVEKGSLVQLLSFFEIRELFIGTDSREPFCLLTLASPLREAASEAECVFFAKSVYDLKDPKRRVILSREDIRILSPNTGTCPVFRSAQDAEISKHVSRRVPVLVREGTVEQNPWGIRFRQGLFHLTNDTKAGLVMDAVQNDGDPLAGAIPVYEAKQVAQFDHRFASYPPSFVSLVDFKPDEVDEGQKVTAENSIRFRYFTDPSTLASRIPREYRHQWFLTYRDVTNAASERTAVSSIVPRLGISYTLRVVTQLSEGAQLAAALLANLNSFPYDYCVRQFIAGNHLSDFIIKQTPVLPPSCYSERCTWSSEFTTLRDWLLPRALELTYTAWDLEPFAKDCGWAGPPFRWDRERRLLLRFELEAAFFHLYLGGKDEWSKQPPGLTTAIPTPCDAVNYIMDTFPIVKREDIQKHGDYRTKLVILDIYDRMQRAIETGEPYQTLLDPPPADPSVAHPPRAT